MTPTTQKKITLATVKAFIKKNRENLYINVKSTFDGMTDGLERCHDGFQKAETDTQPYTQENSLGIKGAWFVGSSRDHFQPYDNIAGDLTGIEIYNSCGSFILAVKK